MRYLFVMALLTLAGRGPTPATAPELVITGELVSIEPSHGCGIFHFGEIAVYSRIKVLSGKWTPSTIRVVHGCSELPRSEYAAEAGSLEAFRVGDVHRLELSRTNYYGVGRLLQDDAGKNVADFYALRVDVVGE